MVKIAAFDEIAPPDTEHPVIALANKSLVQCAATIYEAQLSNACKYGGLQRRKLMAAAAVQWSKNSKNSAAADWIHPALLAAARATAEGQAKGSQNQKPSKAK